MLDVVLSNKFQKIFERVKAQELECHLAILNYFWKHWDELSEKQLAYVEEQNILRSRYPQTSSYYVYFIHSFSDVFPEDIHHMMIDMSITESLNDLLWNNNSCRKNSGNGKITRAKLVERYCVKMHYV